MSEPEIEPPKEAAPPSESPFQEGVVAGRLTLNRQLGKTARGAILWECTCVCGTILLRAAYVIKRSLRKGVSPACRTCWLGDMRDRRKAGWAALRERRNIEMYHRVWDATGSLYSEKWVRETIREIREDSDLPDPIDVPVQPFLIDDEQETAWPIYPDHTEEMTLEEVGAAIGVTRERARQIEWVALRKLRRILDGLEAAGDFKMRIEYLRKHGLLPRQFKHKPLVTKPKVEETNPMGGNPKWDRDKLGIPKDALLPKEAASLLGWPVVSFRNRAKHSGVQPAGYVEGWAGSDWSYYTLEQIEAIRDKYKDKPIQTRHPRGGPEVLKPPAPPEAARRRPRVIKLTEPPPVDATEAFPALLVVKTKFSGIPMTIPVFVQRMARMEDGNHQVSVRFPGRVKDSILSDTIIVWAKDLLTMDYSPFKTPWD